MNRPALCLLAALIAAPSFAAAPMAKTPAPGYFRMMLGDFEVTPLSDGTVDLPVDKLLAQKADKTNATLARAHLKAPLETSDNAFLVNTGSKLILIDTGAGVLFGPTLGKLQASLKAAGYTPEQVDEVYLTHMHSDHLGGLTAQSKAAFPNALVRASKVEADHWLNQSKMDKAPADGKGTFKNAMAALDPYVKAGKFKTFEGDVELAPGIRAQGGHGHTPGHTTYVIESRGRKMVAIGDLIHVAAVQFEDPAVTIEFDGDQKAAAAARKRLFDAAAKDGALVGGAHLQFPGLGYLRTEGKGYRWIPVNYTQMR
ncbi:MULTISPECIES: MBL fold metallo-hydrolase [unclassified Massilia]|uniref:MBL fold metallo-hydrolase n=1 Tax=unclassified Massilia TaxID=2609279 RepID=UPI00177A8EC8|nr:MULTISPECIES: MBL fold metallo-hydrolase [unclassified Massilia]MBD8532825.1 MBL fold metallo-hydrolase [Massilia sp. CFBP 13647]MBD8676186.1 MBL fold metallo-hydrolase [Massilia sp. CFBP 13721]